jgi:hypothetical protein
MESFLTALISALTGTGGMTMFLVYIDTDSDWVQVVPYVDTGSGWSVCS